MPLCFLASLLFYLNPENHSLQHWNILVFSVLKTKSPFKDTTPLPVLTPSPLQPIFSIVVHILYSITFHPLCNLVFVLTIQLSSALSLILFYVLLIILFLIKCLVYNIILVLGVQYNALQCDHFALSSGRLSPCKFITTLLTTSFFTFSTHVHTQSLLASVLLISISSSLLLPCLVYRFVWFF